MATQKATTKASASTFAVYDKMVAMLPAIERKGATLPYTSINGHMFSFVGQEGSISLRLPAEILEEINKKYKATLSEQHGVVMKEYVSIPAKLLKDDAALSAYFKTSYNYVAKLKPKATKKTTVTKVPVNSTKQPRETISAVINTNPKVDEFIAKKNNPLSAEILRVRQIILETDSRIQEDIKWSAPTFIYKGNIASFFMNSKKHVSLMFHHGAGIPDKKGLLEGDGAVSRVAKFTDIKDIEKKKTALQLVIKEWIKMKDKE